MVSKNLSLAELEKIYHSHSQEGGNISNKVGNANPPNTAAPRNN